MKKIFLIVMVWLGLSLPLAAQTQTEDPDLRYGTELLKPGTPAPDFTLNDLEGKPVTLSSFRGRKVVLQFWATWCPDCRAEIPEIKAMQEAADPSKVVFVAVSFDRTLEALQKYARENDLGGVQLFDAKGKKDSQIGELYHVRWIPSLYLLDEKGNVLLGTVVAGKIARALTDSAR